MIRCLCVIALMIYVVAAPVLAGNPLLEEKLQGVLEEFLAENSPYIQQ